AQLKAKIPSVDLQPQPVISQCVQAMKDGRVDAVSTDDIQLAGVAFNDKDVKIVGNPFTVEPYGIGIKKGKADLTKFVTDEVNNMLKDGRWEKIYTQYLSQAPGAISAADAKARVLAAN